MSVRGRNFPSLVTRYATIDEFTLELTVPAPVHHVRIPPPTPLSADAADDRWPGYSFQVLLVASEYCAALQEFMAWSFPPEWEPLKAAVAEHARRFISTSVAVPPPPPAPPSSPADDAALAYHQAALHAYCVWAAFTHHYFHGTRDLTSDGPPERWLRRLVGDRGWHPEGPVFDAANRWVQRTLPRLRPLFPHGIDGLPPPRAKHWHAAGGGGGGRELATRGDAAVRDEGQYVPVYPYRVTGGFQGNRIKFTLKGQQAPRSLRGSCGVPASFGQTNNCALGYLLLADVIQAFYQASERWRQPARELEQQVIRTFFDNVLSSDDTPLCGAAGAGHLQYGYPAAVATCALGWELALEHVRLWVAASEALGGFAAGDGAAAAAGGSMAVRSWLLLPRALQQPGPEVARLAGLQQQLQLMQQQPAAPLLPAAPRSPPQTQPPSPPRLQPPSPARSQPMPPLQLPQHQLHPQPLPVHHHHHTQQQQLRHGAGAGAAMSPFVLMQLQRSAGTPAAAAAVAAAAQPGPPPPPPAWPQQQWQLPTEQRAAERVPSPAYGPAFYPQPGAFAPPQEQYQQQFQQQRQHFALTGPSPLPPAVPPPPPPPPALPALQLSGAEGPRAVEDVAGSINTMSLDEPVLQLGDRTLALLGQETQSLIRGVIPEATPIGTGTAAAAHGVQPRPAGGAGVTTASTVPSPMQPSTMLGIAHGAAAAGTLPPGGSPSPPPHPLAAPPPQFVTAPAGPGPALAPARTVTTEVPWPMRGNQPSSPPPAAATTDAGATVARVAGLLRAAQAAVEQLVAAGPSLHARFAPVLQQHEPSLRAFCEQLQATVAAAAAAGAPAAAVGVAAAAGAAPPQIHPCASGAAGWQTGPAAAMPSVRQHGAGAVPSPAGSGEAGWPPAAAGQTHFAPGQPTAGPPVLGPASGLPRGAFVPTPPGSPFEGNLGAGLSESGGGAGGGAVPLAPVVAVGFAGSARSEDVPKGPSGLAAGPGPSVPLSPQELCQASGGQDYGWPVQDSGVPVKVEGGLQAAAGRDAARPGHEQVAVRQGQQAGEGVGAGNVLGGGDEEGEEGGGGYMWLLAGALGPGARFGDASLGDGAGGGGGGGGDMSYSLGGGSSLLVGLMGHGSGEGLQGGAAPGLGQREGGGGGGAGLGD